VNVLALQGMLVGEGAVSHGLLLRGVGGAVEGLVALAVIPLAGVALDVDQMSRTDLEVQRTPEAVVVDVISVGGVSLDVERVRAVRGEVTLDVERVGGVTIDVERVGDNE
jgi:hypothetical protein